MASQELLFPDVYSHLLKAMHPLIAIKTHNALGLRLNRAEDDADYE